MEKTQAEKKKPNRLVWVFIVAVIVVLATVTLGPKPVAQWFANLANIAFGVLIGSIIGGWFTIKFVVPRAMENAMKNEDVQELKGLLKSLVEMKKFFESLNLPELKTLIEKSVARLEKILDGQRNHG